MPSCITNPVIEEKVVTNAGLRPSHRCMRSSICWLAIAILASNAFATEPTATKWTIDGVEREALVYLPSTSSKAKPPVIFGFHGHGGNMHFSARGMAFQNSWPEAIVVYPQGLPTPGIVLDREGKLPGWQNQAGQQQDRDLKFVDTVEDAKGEIFDR
jgi:polyhydroxybutyrate depolymerase